MSGKRQDLVIAGGIAPLIGAGLIALVVASHDGDASAGIGAWLPIACYLSLLTLITLYTTFKTPETLNRDLDEPRDAWEMLPAHNAPQMTPQPDPTPMHSLKLCAVFGERPALTTVLASPGAHSYNVCRNFISESGGLNRRNVVSGASSRASAFSFIARSAST